MRIGAGGYDLKRRYIYLENTYSINLYKSYIYDPFLVLRTSLFSISRASPFSITNIPF